MSYIGTVLIVDPATPSTWFSIYCARRGLECITVWSSFIAYESQFKLTFNETITESFFYTTDFDLLKRLENKKVVCVSNGSDVGLELSDHISRLFKLTTNEYSDIRSDRYKTVAILNEPACIEQIENFIQTHNRIILKPRLSMGGYDRITILDHVKDIPANINGYFAQPFYEHGKEYGVDIVSKNGRHAITSVWKYIKHPGSIANIRYELLSWQEDRTVMEQIREYVIQVLNRLQYNLGASHIELMHVDGELRLIECNFRCHGHLFDPVMCRALDGKSQTALMTSAYFDDTQFDNYYEYKRTRRVHRVLLTPKTPVHASKISWDMIEKMETIGKIYKQHAWFETVPSNEYQWRHLLANILLIHESYDKLLQDESYIKSVLNCV